MDRDQVSSEAKPNDLGQLDSQLAGPSDIHEPVVATGSEWVDPKTQWGTRTHSGPRLVRVGVILATLGVEAYLGLMTIGFAWGAADSGNQDLNLVGRGILVEMVILLIGGLLCLAGSETPLRVAAVVGAVALVLGVVLVARYSPAFQYDVNSSQFQLFILLPGVVVLVGAGLMWANRPHAPSHASTPG